ncbi:asparaginase [Nitratireductor sp. CAU 1489]|uniref:Asparaginase n=1 Tax=Nitratireductor arenosus TaxID=2682096 RepID=A0A844QPE9_9HYPH|nr:asparaginase [Nitratireductor arenosus]MVA99833.1 asparaginase [Nitratireductor arenosus]
MTNPVLVEVMRGALVESRHRGAVAVIDADGRTMFEIGDVDRPVFPRSAIKAIQALPLVESGAADACGFDDRDLALACASHSGEAAHAERAAAMLARAGLDEDALECGSHWPLGEQATLDLARAGQTPSALHNNCSGKHAGFLCVCCHGGTAHRGYSGYDHPMQRELRAVMEQVTGAVHDRDNAAVDGCSIPTHAVPLRALAFGFARMATGAGLAPRRAEAAKRLLGACMAEPFFMSGSARIDERLMAAAAGRIFCKTGAEGVYCAAIPELGLGVALKCDDGATRASETMLAAMLAKLLAAGDPLATTLRDMARPPVVSRRGIRVGEIRATEGLA